MTNTSTLQTAPLQTAPLQTVAQSRFLIIGYGNKLRGDDAAGSAVFQNLPAARLGRSARAKSA
ncbi:MAG: hypothetical protein WA885_17980 [Phormidesmis sp.]